MIRWGILGAGSIAKQFTQGLQTLPEAELLAVGSRKLETAAAFARQFNVPRKYQSYQDLVMDQDIDVIYIATPHAMHKDNCLLCLEAGKAVLCEKPFTLNARQAGEVIDLARHKKLFCMEAMWMRFIPLIQQVKDIINRGQLGEIRTLSADFGIRAEFEAGNRFFNPNLGGGALLDLGVYLISLAFYLFGPPAHIVSQAVLGQTKVDEQNSIIFRYAQGQLATLSSSLLTSTPTEALITGSRGQLKIHGPIYRPHRLSITKFLEKPLLSTGSLNQGRLSYFKQTFLARRLSHVLRSLLRERTKKMVIPYQGNGYNYEAAEVMRCLKNGVCESEIMPLDETLAIMETLDTIRAQWNFKYPQESSG